MTKFMEAEIKCVMAYCKIILLDKSAILLWQDNWLFLDRQECHFSDVDWSSAFDVV